MVEYGWNNLSVEVAAKAKFSLLASRFFVPPRIDHQELLDIGAGEPGDVQQSLDDLWRINRYLGGIQPLTHHLFPRLLQSSETATLVDIGTGSGHILLQIAEWAADHQRDINMLGLDLAARHLDIARKTATSASKVSFLQADALQLPIKDQSVDYFISSLFLHHLSPAQIVTLLGQAFTKVRKALIFSDLQRGWLPYIAFKCLQPIFARSYLTRHDGAVSVRRAYTPDEFLAFAHQAGLSHARVFRHFPWRMTLVVEKPDADV